MRSDPIFSTIKNIWIRFNLERKKKCNNVHWVYYHQLEGINCIDYVDVEQKIDLKEEIMTKDRKKILRLYIYGLAANL